MSSPNTIRFNARVKSQRKTLIILLLIAMVSFFFITFHFVEECLNGFYRD